MTKRELRDKATSDVDALHVRVMSSDAVKAALDATKTRRGRAKVIAKAVLREAMTGKLPVWWNEG